MNRGRNKRAAARGRGSRGRLLEVDELTSFSFSVFLIIAEKAAACFLTGSAVIACGPEIASATIASATAGVATGPVAVVRASVAVLTIGIASLAAWLLMAVSAVVVVLGVFAEAVGVFFI